MTKEEFVVGPISIAAIANYSRETIYPHLSMKLANKGSKLAPNLTPIKTMAEDIVIACKPLYTAAECVKGMCLMTD